MMGSIPPGCARGTFRRLTGADRFAATGEGFLYDYDKVGNRATTLTPFGLSPRTKPARSTVYFGKAQEAVGGWLNELWRGNAIGIHERRPLDDLRLFVEQHRRNNPC